MATEKKNSETKDTKYTARKKTARKAAGSKPAEIIQLRPDGQVKEPSVFEKMAALRNAGSTTVETPAGMVEVAKRISLNDMILLINLIVSMCTDQATGMVKWEIYDYITKLVICSVYCGEDVPQDLEAGYNAVCGEDGLYNHIAGAIDEEQLNNIWDSTTERLTALETLNCSTAVGKLNQFLENVQQLMEAIGEAADGFDASETEKAIGKILAFDGRKLTTGDVPE